MLEAVDEMLSEAENVFSAAVTLVFVLIALDVLVEVADLIVLYVTGVFVLFVLFLLLLVLVVRLGVILVETL